MSEHDPLPEWAQAQIRTSQIIIDALNEKLDFYNQQSAEQDKAIVLVESLAMLAELDGIARRYKFFVKSSGLTEARNSLQLEASELESKGFSVQVASSLSLTNVLFIDTETTGLGQEDQPVSIGAVLSEVDVYTGLIRREVCSYYGLRDPSCEISPGALRVHGLSKAKLTGQEFDIGQLVCMFGVADLIVAHNSRFDRGMLRFIDNESRNWACSCWDVDWPKEIGGRSLDAICAYFSVGRENPHNSISDTRAMISVLQQRKVDGSPYLLQLLEKRGNKSAIRAWPLSADTRVKPAGKSAAMMDLRFSNVDAEQLAQCTSGDRLNLWLSPDQSFVNAYRRGSMGGQGRVATLYCEENPRLLDMMTQGRPAWLIVERRTDSTYALDLHMMTAEEVLTQQKEAEDHRSKQKNRSDST